MKFEIFLILCTFFYLKNYTVMMRCYTAGIFLTVSCLYFFMKEIVNYYLLHVWVFCYPDLDFNMQFLNFTTLFKFLTVYDVSHLKGQKNLLHFVSWITWHKFNVIWQKYANDIFVILVLSYSYFCHVIRTRYSK